MFPHTLFKASHLHPDTRSFVNLFPFPSSSHPSISAFTSVLHLPSISISPFPFPLTGRRHLSVDTAPFPLHSTFQPRALSPLMPNRGEDSIFVPQFSDPSLIQLIGHQLQPILANTHPPIPPIPPSASLPSVYPLPLRLPPFQLIIPIRFVHQILQSTRP